MLLRRLGLLLIAGLVALIGSAFLVAAAYLWLATVLPVAAATAVVGGGLLVLAAIALFAGLRRGQREPPGPEQLVFAALGLVARYIRAAPGKALIAALIAGVVSEWLGDRRRPAGRNGPKRR
jgi:hypothetical protein